MFEGIRCQTISMYVAFKPYDEAVRHMATGAILGGILLKFAPQLLSLESHLSEPRFPHT